MADEAQDPTPGGHGPGDSNMGMRERADDGPDGKLYPVAVALRATFDADNHATLSRDVTGLMLDLSRVPFEPPEFEPLLRPLAPPPPAGWLARARLALRRLREARG